MRQEHDGADGLGPGPLAWAWEGLSEWWHEKRVWVTGLGKRFCDLLADSSLDAPVLMVPEGATGLPIPEMTETEGNARPSVAACDTCGTLTALDDLRLMDLLPVCPACWEERMAQAPPSAEEVALMRQQTEEIVLPPRVDRWFRELTGGIPFSSPPPPPASTKPHRKRNGSSNTVCAFEALSPEWRMSQREYVERAKGAVTTNAVVGLREVTG